MVGVQWLTAFRFIAAGLISYEISFTYQWDDHFWSVIYSIMTLLSIPHERVPFAHAFMIAADRVVGSILGCAIGLSSYVFLTTIILEDYFFWLVDLAIVMNIFLGSYLYAASKRLQMSVVSSVLILSLSFLSDDIIDIVLIYVYEIMIGVLVACAVYVVTLPLFYWDTSSRQRARHKAQTLRIG